MLLQVLGSWLLLYFIFCFGLVSFDFNEILSHFRADLNFLWSPIAGEGGGQSSRRYAPGGVAFLHDPGWTASWQKIKPEKENIGPLGSTEAAPNYHETREFLKTPPAISYKVHHVSIVKSANMCKPFKRQGDANIICILLQYCILQVKVKIEPRESRQWMAGIIWWFQRFRPVQSEISWHLLISSDFFGFLRISLFFINSPRSQLTGESQSVSKELAPQEEQSVIQAKATAPCDMRQMRHAMQIDATMWYDMVQLYRVLCYGVGLSTGCFHKRKYGL